MDEEIRLPLGIRFIYRMTCLQGMMFCYCRKFTVSRDTDSIPIVRNRPIMLLRFSGVLLLPASAYGAYSLYRRIVRLMTSEVPFLDFVHNLSSGLKQILDFVTIIVMLFKRRQIIETVNILLNTLGQLEALGKNMRIRDAWGWFFSFCVVFSYITQLANQITHVNVFFKGHFYYKLSPIFGGLLRITSFLHIAGFCFVIERAFRLVHLNLESVQNLEDPLLSETSERPESLLRRLRILYARLETVTSSFSEIYGPVLYSICSIGSFIMVFDMFVYIKLDKNRSHLTYFLGSCILFFRLWLICRHAHGLVREAERSNELAALLDSSTWNPRVRVEISGTLLTYILLLTQIPSSIPVDSFFNTGPDE